MAAQAGCGPRLLLLPLLFAACWLAQAAPTDEVKQLEGEDQDGGDEIAEVHRSGPLQKFNRLTKGYDTSFRNQMVYNQKMAVKNTLPRVPDGPVTYSKVPWFALKANSKLHPRKTYDDCELYCTKYVACRSFSYDATGRNCITSEAKMAYDPNFVFYTKKLGKDDKPAGNDYESFPGMKFELSGNVVREGGSFLNCEYLCSRAKEVCSGFSYSQQSKTCIQTSEPLHYSTTYNYYEKNGQSSSDIQQEAEHKESLGKKRAKELFAAKFEANQKQEDDHFQAAVDKKEAKEMFVKETEHEMRLNSQKVKESRMKFDVSEMRKRRYEHQAKEQDLTVEHIAMQEKNLEVKKELAEKQKSQATTSEEKTEAAVKVAEVEAKEAEVSKENSAAKEKAEELTSEAESAEQDEENKSTEIKAAADEQEKEKQEMDAGKASKSIADTKEKVESAKIALENAQLGAKEAAANEANEKKILAKEQEEVALRERKCASELDAQKKKEICAKAAEDKKRAADESERNQEDLETQMSDADDAKKKAAELSGDRQALRKMKKLQLRKEQASKSAMMKKETDEKAGIKKANVEADQKEKERLAVQRDDREKRNKAEEKEMQSKKSQVEDIKARIVRRQKQAQADERDGKSEKKFSNVLKEQTYEKAEKDAKKLAMASTAEDSSPSRVLQH